jgi:hypothetical protein
LAKISQTGHKNGGRRPEIGIPAVPFSFMLFS